MCRRTIWTLAGAMVAVLIIAGAVGAEWLLGLSERVLNPVRYRVETRLEVGDHGRIVRSAFVSGVVGTGVVVAGFGYFWIRFRIDPTPRAVAHGVTLVMTIVEMIGEGNFLGLMAQLGALPPPPQQKPQAAAGSR